ncbi:MAG: xanthine dehydrogenase family protein molybdopterin-binding subunit [Candidatus Bipolaricaulis sp.]|nr:xanthine dehydrogenase family protein molybdopterin-binding subunit [Candidatus Bipolaricaulis sp.]
MTRELTYVGKSVPRDDAADKVTGAARYTHDLSLPGMLHAALVTSPHAAARIARIDASDAARLPGVRAVLTGADVDVRLGLYMQDKRILAHDVVRYQGEPVVAVAADTLDIAREACRRIHVEYEPRPAVLDPREAMKTAAALVHPDLGSYSHMEGVFFPTSRTNIAHHQKIRKGDVDAAFASAEVILKAGFDNPPVQHVPMETHASIAQALPGGRAEIWTSSQSPYTVRHLMSIAFGLPHNAVRVHVPYVGGGFGGKAGLNLEPLVYVLSKAAGGRPVRFVATREEEFNTLPSRQGLYSTIEIGTTRAGTIVALKATYVWDAGAYADYGVNVGRAAAYSGAGPYAIPNCWIDSFVVYTNKVYGTAYRGFGHLEVLWGVERAMDQMARKLGLDPAEFRRRNLLKPGDMTITGETFTAGHGEPSACLDAVAGAIDWGTPSPPPVEPTKRRGKGIAMLHKAPAMPTSTACSAIIKLDEDGAADILVSGVDYGQGTYTVLRQIAAEELRLPIQAVHINSDCDTAFTPYDWQTVASRFAYMGGHAVLRAAGDCLGQIRAVAAQVFGVATDKIVCENASAYPAGEPERAIPYRDLALGYTYPNGNAIGGPVIGHGRFIAHDLTHLDPDTGQGRPAQFWTYGAHGVEIEVDTETGEIEILRIATAIDAGKVLNAGLARGQVIGGVVQGIGSALWEGFRFDRSGHLLNPSFVDYKIPTAKDLPREMTPILLENPQPDGPYGARGIAEHPMISVPSAIGNALFDALGIEFASLPLSPESVVTRLAERGAEP